MKKYLEIPEHLVTQIESISDNIMAGRTMMTLGALLEHKATRRLWAIHSEIVPVDLAGEAWHFDHDEKKYYYESEETEPKEQP